MVSMAAGCRSVDASVPAYNGRTESWLGGYLQECMQNAAVTGLVVQLLFRHTRPGHGPIVRQAALVLLFSSSSGS
jgi:hypothetical protein